MASKPAVAVVNFGFGGGAGAAAEEPAAVLCRTKSISLLERWRENVSLLDRCNEDSVFVVIWNEISHELLALGTAVGTLGADWNACILCPVTSPNNGVALIK